MGIIPLILFVIIDSFFGVKKAALATIFMGALEVIYSIYYFGEIDQLSVITLITIFLFSGFSFYFNRGIFIKLQPVIMSAFFSLSLIYSYLVEKPLLLDFALKYSHLLPRENQLMITNNHFQDI